MKPFRIAVVLMALLVLLLFVGQVFAAVTYTRLDTLYVPFGKISKNTKDRALLGFRIDGVGAGKSLKSIIVESFIQRAYSIENLKLYMEDNDSVGLQVGVGGDKLVKTLPINGRFDSNYRGRFTGLIQALHAAPDSNLFYLAIDANTDTVGTYPADFDGQCLEVIIEPDSLKLNDNSANPDTIYNKRYGGVDDDTTGFCPDLPPNHGPGCRYRLCFDTFGPRFNLHFCIAANACSVEAYYPIEPYIRVPMVNQEDSIRICATNIDSDIDTTEGIHIIGKVEILGYVGSLHMFGVDDILLKWDDNVGESSDSCQKAYCDDDYSTIFQIPDERNTGGFVGVDADTGHWYVCGWAKDWSGNIDTICIGHEDLVYRIDTKKPIIDSISWQFVKDLNGDGKIGLGDSIMIIGWGRSNPIVPLKEVDKMEVDWSWYTGNPSPDWVELDDKLENNRIFRKVFGLTNPVPIDSNGGCPVNFLVQAWDNACNHDTLRGEICADMDLEPPTVDVTYTWDTDYDTMWACMSLGDKVLIRADVGGNDIVSVTAMMDSMGIDKLMRHALLLPHRGGGLYGDGGLYDTIWTITEPPIQYGKDRDNTQPPDRDSLYRAWVTVCDDAHNCVTGYADLNKTLDTRRPRPIGYFCPDSVPCAIVATPLPGGVIKLEWDTACDENDAFAFYVWASYNGAPFDSIGYTDETEQLPGAHYWSWHSEPLAAGGWTFKIKTEDNCSNVGDFSCEVGTIADSTPPNACLVFPDSGGIYGDPFAVKARSDDQDIQSVCLWYRLRSDLNDPPTGEAGQWTVCQSAPCMYRPDNGLVFLDTITCVPDGYVGWVELLPLSCDVIGNCQDTTRAYAEACIDDSLQNLRPGHFLFYWDTTRPTVRVVSVNDTISPQTLCGYNVNPDIMNQVIINVDGAKPTDLFTIDVKAIKYKKSYRIDYRNHVTMPCTIMVSVDNWDAGTQHLYVRVTSEANGKECIPYPLTIDLCVPPQTAPCITIVAPHEWMRIPCSKTDKTCVPIWAEITPGCPESLVTQVKFFYSKNTPGPPWNLIEEVIQPDTEWVLGHPVLYWKTCWNNLGLVQDGDTVYFMAEGFNQFHVGGASKMVKVFVDCNAPQVKLRIEDVITTCQGIPKVAGEIILKALVVDTLVDITELNFWYKLHSDPDIPAYWHKLCDAERGWWWESNNELEPWSENIWAGDYDTEDLPNQTWIDIRVSVKDQAGNVWQDYDEDGKFDDSTFDAAVAADAGITVFVDNQAPAPAISMVADTTAKIYNVNPSTLLGGSGEAYVKAGDDINSQISVLPSEDTCEVMKVEWFLCMPEVMDDVVATSPAQGSKFIHEAHQGDNCENPIELTLPRDLPFDDTNHTCGRGDDYHHTCLAPFDSSDDIIYKLNVTTNVVLRIKWQTFKMRNSGLALFDECPGHHGADLSGPDLVTPTGPKCGSAGINAHEWHHLKGEHGCPVLFLEPGTYYLMLDSKHGCIDGSAPSAGGQAPQDLEDGNFELEITGEATGCYHVGTSNDPYHFPVKFNPVKDGLIPAYELEDHFWHGSIQAVLYDSLGNYKTDDVGLYILDVTPSQAVIVNPLNDSYVSGDVTLMSMSLNDYEICKVCYEYKPEGDSVWHPVNDGYPNACTTDRQGFMITWHTLNTIPDGAYYLRAVATDCSNNVDTLPPTIKVTVSNGVPVVTMDDPRICSRTCPDDTVDTLGYISGMVPLYATVSSTIPVTKVEFYYKNIFTYPSQWTYIGTDNDSTNGKYSVEWGVYGNYDGRYHLKAVAYTASGKYGESKPIVVSVDNSGPFAEIISIMGEDHLANGVDISKGTVVPIEIVAIDSTSSDGWTRCYNSGLTKISVCIAMCDSNYKPKDSTEITKCFEVDSVYDGIHTVQWNTSGLQYEGCSGCYYIYVKAYDCLGNLTVSDSVKVYVRDITAPITTIGGFNRYYDAGRKDYLYSILGYSDEKVQSLLFEYADSGLTNWTPIGWSSYINAPACDYYLYMTTWNPASLKNGIYQVRVISHDTCSNQADSLAPWAYIYVEGGIITPYNPGVLGKLSFEKNWCVGGMHGIVRQTSSSGTPVVLAYYGGDYGECVEMQPGLQNTTEYAGSFNADYITYGGPAEFFSSVTIKTGDESMTGEPTYVTYLNQGNFDVVKVKRDVGTEGTFKTDCVEVTIPGGAVGNASTEYRYLWVSPTTMPWTPPTQPNLKPIGDNDGYATYVSFTDCYYCCGYWKSHYGGAQGDVPKSPASESYGDCCFNTGRWAKIKMCYNSTVTTDSAHLAVMWWDCEDGEFKSDNILNPIFNTTDHTVEFGTTCLSGPFAVVERLERPCNGSIVVSMRAQDIEPYCNGYTNSMPKFTSLITDNVQGPSGIDKSSIQFKVDLFESGNLVRIYDGGHYSDCHKWATGFGSFLGAGYDKVSGLFRAGWNDSTFMHSTEEEEHWSSCDGCYNYDFGGTWRTRCYPMYPLSAGDHIATLTAMNDQIQTCTDTVQFTVDATKPKVLFDTIQVYVSRNPVFYVYMWDKESGVNRDNMYMDLFGSNTSSPSPDNHSWITTIKPSQLASMWVNDTTLRVDLRSLNLNNSGYLHVWIYDGLKREDKSEADYVYYYYEGGVSDCVGNKTTSFWHYYVVDKDGPTITSAYTTLCDTMLKFQISDAMSGLANVYVYEDSTNKLLIERDPHNPIYWYYTPSEGPHHVDIRAVDSLNNWSTYSFDLKGDCVPPVVSFIASYVNCKTPTVKIVITDAGLGVDWSKLKVDLYYSNLLLQTFEPSGPNAWVRNGDTVTVVGNGAQLSLYDGADLYAVVYSEKSSVTSYTKGPVDLAGNWTDPKWIIKDYKADCYGPSITFRGTGYCDDSLKYEITDAKSGLAHVYVYEDSSKKDLFKQDEHNPIYWYYKPSKGRHHVDIEAIDTVNNRTLYSFDVTGDCTPPLASFGADFVACYNPTVEITLTDDGSGVDWTKVYVDLWRYSDRIQTFTPDMLVREGNTITVTGDGAWLGLTDGSTMNVYVYSAKTPGTSYTKGPLDSAGNYQTATSWFSKSYTADCSGPSVTWVWPSPTAIDSCSATLTFKITDTYSGMEGIVITEDGAVVPHTAYSYDPLTLILTYTPSAGKHKVVITATDKLGNVSTYTFFRKDDCVPPGVKFVGEYVTKNPTVKIVVKDDKVGIDWNTVNVDLFQRDYPYKQCTFTAADIANFNMRHGDTVIVSCTMDLTDGATLIAYVYAEKTSGTGPNPAYGRGPADLSSNYMPKWQECIYQVDAGPPTIIVTNLSERPIQICFSDSGSGIDWSTLEFYEDSVLICQGLGCVDTNVHLDTVKACMAYEPGAGRKYVEIRVRDRAGNWIIYTFWTEEQNLFFTNPHNYPNPFDPSERSTYIDLGLSKSAYVTVKIYDFAGEFVRELLKGEFTGISTEILWDGKTDDGAEVANGTYLCYIHARDDSGKIETAVIKITVLKKDK